MIDEDRTAQLYGYTSDELSPKSGKPIVVVCEECGKHRINSKSQYRELCHDCSIHTPEYIQKHTQSQRSPELSKIRSDRATKQWKDENIRDSMLCGINDSWTDDRRSIMSEAVSKENHYYYGMRGEGTPNWKGGKKPSRDHLKTYNDCILLNDKFDGTEAHL